LLKRRKMLTGIVGCVILKTSALSLILAFQMMCLTPTLTLTLTKQLMR